MIKQAFDEGVSAALKRFNLEKTAVGLIPTVMARGRQFLRGQAGAATNLFSGLRGMLGPTTGTGARGQAWEGLKGLAPTIGAGVGAHYLMHRNDQQQPQQQPPPMY